MILKYGFDSEKKRDFLIFFFDFFILIIIDLFYASKMIN